MKNFKKMPKQDDVEEFKFGSNRVFVIKMTDDFALSMYADEPCRICGELLTMEQVHTRGATVFAGYSDDNKSRCAHKSCWDMNVPKEGWAYPNDDTESE